MRNDPDGLRTVPLDAFERRDGDIKRLFVQRTEPLVKEQRLDMQVPCVQLSQPERQRQRHLKALAAGKIHHWTQFAARAPVDDAWQKLSRIIPLRIPHHLVTST